ncbi:MAG: UDP-N-acetylmuramoyl-L-alanyl-D-glutamate--2,6-diaminopimelate ligase [Rhabdochlamydiaceae bacterium]|jgi:UDP-N-acetylmuramoyl-L-alanyl-D-glutamate--2,6-diaminopimelate ligase
MMSGIIKMKIKTLFKDIDSVEIRGGKDVDITGISANSKSIGPGFLFIVKRGQTFNGSKFIPEVVAAGASAILTDTYNPFLTEVSQVIHPDPASIELTLAKRFYRDPASKMEMIGVTGTNGKTTTTFLIKYLLEKNKKVCGLIGTVMWMTGKKVFPSTHTTPDALTLTRLFSEMVDADATTSIIEVTSHALEQKRVAGIDFQTAVFTNLTQDHLDYHKTMDAYADAKALLFSSLSSSAWAVINIDDPVSSVMMRSCKAHLLTYGLISTATLRASDLKMTARSMRFNIHYKGQVHLLKTQLIGRFNVYNILAAAGVALIHGMSLADICKAMKNFAGIPGRLERVSNRKKLQVFVDFSHTPDALEKALKTLQEFNKGRLITVYGCGGDRDAQKRPLMGLIAEKLSDVAILTSDNPRSESPEAIARQVLEGCKEPEKTIVELDRQRAIAKAIKLATPRDIILIAGKGHETTQTFAHRTIHFDDREVAKDACGG